jgi:hypothetical protein
MKTILLSLFATLATLTGFAQNSSSVKGTISDASAKPVAAASVSLLLSKDSSIYKVAASDNAGTYQFENVKSGSYLVMISGINYINWYSPAFDLAEGSNYTVENASLVVADKKLKDVVVTSSKKPMIEVKADRTVFNVENSINATGSTAMELLQKSPGVTVDKDDNINMKGKMVSEFILMESQHKWQEQTLLLTYVLFKAQISNQ